jgi:AcrR family transcriptional regulator
VFRSKYEVSEAILLSKVTPEQFKCRRDLILAAATRVFARSGCAQATMQDVAAEAGLSVGAIYRYYPGKEQLVRAVFDRIGESTRSLFGRAMEAAESPADILRNAGRVIMERFKEEPTREETILVLEAILSDARRSDELVAGQRQLRGAYLFLTERLFRQAQELGALDPTIDADGLALLFVSLMVGIHVLSLEMKDAMELEPLLGVVDEMLRRLSPQPCEDLDGVDEGVLVAIGGRE